MNTRWYSGLLSIASCCLTCLAACGGTVVSQTEYEPSALSSVDAGSEPAPQPTFDAGKPTLDAAKPQTESGPEASIPDSGVEPPTDAKPPTILALEYAGAIPQNHPAGSTQAVLFRYTACATKNLLLTIQEFMIFPFPEAKNQGSQGSLYFNDFFMADETVPGDPTAWAGPEELFAVQSKPQPERVRLIGAYPIMANTCLMLALTADLATDQDAPGEFFGGTYQVGFVGQGATVLAGGDEPQNREIDFEEILFGELTGESFTVSGTNE